MSSDSLARQLEALPADTRDLLGRHRFDRAHFEGLAAHLASGTTTDNYVRGLVSPPEPTDVVELPPRGCEEWARLEKLGVECLSRGQCALLVMAGGMATRMGGVVKALAEALPGRSFLDLRLAEIRALETRVGRAPPFWLLTSHSTDTKIREALGARLDGERIGVFTQYLSLRLTPAGDLYLDAEGRPSDYAPGHGDLVDALRDSGLLTRFVERGGRAVMVANIDNLGATLDPVVLGWHLAHGAPASCEVVDKVGSDRGGIPVRLDGRPVVLEEFRIPPGFDPATVPVFNTNTFHFDAPALLDLRMRWTYFLVRKMVGPDPVVQFERLLGEVTSGLETRFLHLPRIAPESRFLPVKDPEELLRRRPEIESVLEARGILA
jgi:UTP--glucose-1-phosphate uridylyltransferase